MAIVIIRRRRETGGAPNSYNASSAASALMSGSASLSVSSPSPSVYGVSSSVSASMVGRAILSVLGPPGSRSIASVASASISGKATLHVSRSIGRYRYGDRVDWTLHLDSPPDDLPTFVVMPSSGNVAYSGFLIPVRDTEWDFVAGFVPRSPTYGIGKFYVDVSYSAGGTQFGKSFGFEVVGGGDSYGSVISMYSFDRPSGHFVLCQLQGGVAVQGSSPKT
jgi:hypothetical protein